MGFRYMKGRDFVLPHMGSTSLQLVNVIKKIQEPKVRDEGGVIVKTSALYPSNVISNPRADAGSE
jgi:hypothetical protein